MTIDSAYFPEVYKKRESLDYRFQFELTFDALVQVYTIDADGLYTLLDGGSYIVTRNPYRGSIARGGTVTLGGPLGDDIASISINRKTPITDTQEFPAGEAFNAQAYEFQADKLTMVLQEANALVCDCRGGSVPIVAPFIFAVQTTNFLRTFSIPCLDVGTYDAVVDWGDGSTSTITSFDDLDLTHTYGATQEYTVEVTGTLPSISFLLTPNENSDFLVRVLQLGTMGWLSFNGAFRGQTNLVEFRSGITDTSNVTDMFRMFQGNTSIPEGFFNISTLDTSSVTDMGFMFSGFATSVSNALDLTMFDTSNVTNMSFMFEGVSQGLNLSSFDTSNVTNMSRMFSLSTSLVSLNITNFDTSSVVDMGWMFSGCTSLSSLNVSNFDTTNVVQMQGMFNNMYSLPTLNLSSFNTANVQNMTAMFSNSLFTSLNLSTFNVSSVTEFWQMFSECSDLTVLNVSGWDTSSATRMDFMFQGCTDLTALDVSSFNTASVTDMGFMFQRCLLLTTIDVSGFGTANCTRMTSMFDNCKAVTSLDLSNFNTALVQFFSRMFAVCDALPSLNVSTFNTSNALTMSSMFSSLGSPSGTVDVVGIENFNIESLNSVSSLSNFANIFALPSARYSSLLINWNAQNPLNNMTVNFGFSQYTPAGASARAGLIASDNWTILDGGPV